MRAFCPSCDAEVVFEPGKEPRCPNCHRRLEVEDQLAERPEGGGKEKGKAGAIIAVIVVLAFGLGGGWWWSHGQSVEAPESVTVKAGEVPRGDWRAVFANGVLSPPRASAPDLLSDELSAAAEVAGDVEGLKKWLDKLKNTGGLRPLPRGQRRTHPVRTGAALFAELSAGESSPAHPLEVAWMLFAVCKKLKIKTHFVVDRAGVQTPIMLTRLRVAVQTDEGVLLDPLDQSFVDKKPIQPDEIALWWLVLRAQAEREAGHFKRAHADLSVAAQIAPNEAAVAFGQGVLAMEQGLLEQGLERCEGALVRREDAMARLFLVQVLSQLGRPFKALGHLEVALKIKPVLPEAWVSKGLLESAQAFAALEGDKARHKHAAEEAFQKALALDSAVPGAREGLARLLDAKKDKEGRAKQEEAATQREGQGRASALSAPAVSAPAPSTPAQARSLGASK